MIPEPRRRLKVDWLAKCGTAPDARACRILDISPDGASIKGSIGEGDDSVLLFCENAAPIAATIAWRHEGRMGLRFDAPQAWVKNASARRFDAAGWL